MAMPTILVAFCTKGPYEVEAARLLASCKRLTLELVLRVLPCRGAWTANSHIRPGFLLKLLDKFPDNNLLSIDVDAVLHSNPLPLVCRIGADIAVHRSDGRAWPGTLWLNQRVPTRKFLRRWAELNVEKPKRCDRFNFRDALSEFVQAGRMQVAELPPEMCYIFDVSRKLYPDVEPIIEHLQASRGLRELIGVKT